MTNFFRNK